MGKHMVGNVTVVFDDKEITLGQVSLKMNKAVPMALAMVEAARTALHGHIARRPPGGPGLHYPTEEGRARAIGNLKGRLANDPLAPNDVQDEIGQDQTQIGQGLVKYFNLRSSEKKYWQYVKGLLKTFLKIDKGLSSAYTVEVKTLDKDERGRVMGYGAQGNSATIPSPIRKAFGFPDEWDHHILWISYASRGNIELSPEWVLKGKPDEVARTIVHEASHKFASTNDILYKHQTFAKTKNWKLDDVQQHQEERNQKVAAALAEMAAEELDKAKISDIPNRKKPTKPLVPMMGFEGGHPGLKEPPDVIVPERWLENADSYAWFARRMYKRLNPADFT